MTIDPLHQWERCDNEGESHGGFVNTFFEERVEQLFDLAGLVEKSR